MFRSFWPVAILGLLLALALPVAAQEGSEPASEPAQDNSEGTRDSNDNSTARPSTAPGAPPCPIAAQHIGDPAAPMSQWIIVDPDGCVRNAIRRILERP